jgi:hypothetical protein
VTTFTEVDVRCAVCGELARVAELTSTSSFGPPDLDLRPQGPARWALELEIQRCGACGYCAPELGKAPPGAAEVVRSALFETARTRTELPGAARDYVCAAFVHEGVGDASRAAHGFLRAAWACDDVPAETQARICRERAAELLRRAIDRGEAGLRREVAFAVLADIERRARRFDGALAACDEAEWVLETLDEDDARSSTWVVVAYIRELAEAEDDACHSAAEAFAERD